MDLKKNSSLGRVDVSDRVLFNYIKFESNLTKYYFLDWRAETGIFQSHFKFIQATYFPCTFNFQIKMLSVNFFPLNSFKTLYYLNTMESI